MFSEKLMQRMLYLLQGRLSFILPELTEIKSDSNLIKNECHCILHGAEKTGKNLIIKQRHPQCMCNREAQREAVNEGMRAEEIIEYRAKYNFYFTFYF